MLKLGVFAPVRASSLTTEERLHTIRSSMFLKHKISPQGVFLKCKARLVAGGDLQDKSLYSNTSAPTATTTVILVEAGIAAVEKKDKATIDIGGAFLNADMTPTGVTVHMNIDAYLTGILVSLEPSYAQFIKPNGTITVKLVKALYGTVEAAKLWYDLITKILCDVGFAPNPYDKCVLNKPCTAGKALTVVLFVDDLLILGPYNEIQWLKGYLESKFPEVSYHEGEVLDYIGMTLDFQKLPGKACITMKQITDDIIDTSGVTITHPTPADANLFDVNESSPRLSPPLEAYFRTYVAKGLYLAKRVRPEILVAIAFLATRAAVCTDEDMVKLVRVIGYLRREPDRGIVIDVGDDPAVGAFINAAYGVHKQDGKSHTGASLVYGIAGPVYVTSVKQSIVTKSSTESELVAFSDVASEALSLRNYLIAQGQSRKPAIIYQDNNSTMTLISKGGPCSGRSRHIDIRHFWISEKVADGSVIVVRCPTETMWAMSTYLLRLMT